MFELNIIDFALKTEREIEIDTTGAEKETSGINLEKIRVKGTVFAKTERRRNCKGSKQDNRATSFVEKNGNREANMAENGQRERSNGDVT